MSPDPVRVEWEGGLAVLTLDAPPLNLFDRPLIDALQAAVAALAADPPRALLIRAEGRAVSGGVDVHVFDGLTPEQGSALWTDLLGTIAAVETLPAPVVFAAHALTLTAAFELALACDLIVAAPEARFGLVEKVVGLTPSMGGTQRLAERAGSGRARQLVMTGDLFTAAELERWGVVNTIFDAGEGGEPGQGGEPGEEGRPAPAPADSSAADAPARATFDARARALAADLAAGPTKAHAMTKHILRRYREGGVPAADEAVRTEAAALFATEDLQQAVRTFLEQGAPGHAKFHGR